MDYPQQLSGYCTVQSINVLLGVVAVSQNSVMNTTEDNTNFGQGSYLG
jgi:hypothetical protein